MRSDREHWDKYKVTNETKVYARVRYTGRRSGKTGCYYQIAINKSRTQTKLTVLDGSIAFWVNVRAIQIVKVYKPGMTIGQIRRFVGTLDKPERSGSLYYSSSGKR